MQTLIVQRTQPSGTLVPLKSICELTETRFFCFLNKVVGDLREMNNSELFAFLPFMIEDERSPIFTAPMHVRIILRLIYFVFGFWGIFAKLFLMYNLTKEKFAERPINILIVIDQSVDFISNMVITFDTFSKVSFLIPFLPFIARFTSQMALLGFYRDSSLFISTSTSQWERESTCNGGT